MTDSSNSQCNTPRTVLLQDALELVSIDRNSAYGNPEDNFKNIANYWNIYLHTASKLVEPLTPQDIAHLMILMKLARLTTNPNHRDSLVDIAGYAACGEDCRLAAQTKIFSAAGH